MTDEPMPEAALRILEALKRLPKNTVRKMAQMKVTHNGPEKHKDGRIRDVRRIRFDYGRYLDRSKYNGDGSKK